jgi:hypothetical protein
MFAANRKTKFFVEGSSLIALAIVVSSLNIFCFAGRADEKNQVSVQIAVEIDSAETVLIVRVDNKSDKPLGAIFPGSDFNKPVVTDPDGRVHQSGADFDTVPDIEEIQPGKYRIWRINTAKQIDSFKSLREKKGVFRVYWVFRSFPPYGNEEEVKSNEILLINDGAT